MTIKKLTTKDVTMSAKIQKALAILFICEVILGSLYLLSPLCME